MKKIKSTLRATVVSCLLAIPFLVQSQTPPATIANSLQTILDNSLPNTFSKPGAVMRITVPGEWTWSGASGYAIAGITSGQPESSATEDMQFRVGSITKMMVATCIMKLEQDGLLSIDDLIDNYLRPTLINDTINSSGSITIRQLLNHTSGIANSADNATCQTDVLSNPLGSHTLEDAVYCGASQGEFFAPGLMWGYSNTNYTLLAMIIEEVTGQSYASFLQQTILTPLNLTNTIVHPSDQIPNPHMGCYWNIGSWIDLTVINSTTYTGWADIVSTTEDLIKFYTELLNENIINSAQLTRMKTIDAASFDYGMGLDFYNLVSTDYYGHYGEVANTSGLFFVDINSGGAPNGYYISYNYNVQGANTPVTVDQPVIELLSQLSNLEELTALNVRLYPNPAKETCTISMNMSTNDLSLAIYDLKGSKIYTKLVPPSTSKIQLDVSTLEKGIYFVHIEGANTQRLIVD
ncbi:MAG: serine hydrolase [Crocinitomicaceae bacterium]|nr:serine hydrolase [Crocinitomicaceae bacterium]